jgi:hypothetical protein
VIKLIQFECGCSTTNEADGTYLGGRFCDELDPVIDRVMLAGVSNEAWEWMDMKIAVHLMTARQFAEL